MNSVAPILAVLLLISSGCGIQPAKPPVPEEPRHPSNAMDPPKKPVESEHSEASKPAAARRSPAKPSNRVPAYEDPRRIPVGLEYREMVRRFGSPSMKVTDGPSLTTFSYSKLKTQVQVEVQDGKVVSVAAIDTGF